MLIVRRLLSHHFYHLTGLNVTWYINSILLNGKGDLLLGKAHQKLLYIPLKKHLLCLTDALPHVVRSMVGLVPLFASLVLQPDTLSLLPEFKKRMDWLLKHNPELAKQVCMHMTSNISSLLYLIADVAVYDPIMQQ